MKPVLSDMRETHRAALFLPIWLGVAFLLFVLVGFASDAFLASLLVGVLGGLGAAYSLVGWPVIRRKDGKPLVNDKVRPWLFFPLALVLVPSIYWSVGVYLTPVLPPGLEAYAALTLAFIGGSAAAYFLVGFPRVDNPKIKPWLFFPLAVTFVLAVYWTVGLYLTPVLSPDVVAYVALTLGILTGAGSAYFLVGFPNLTQYAREAWGKIPPARRPWLFFPLYLVTAALGYFLLGLAITQTPIPLGIQPLIVLPIALVLGALLSYKLVGFPRPKRDVREMVPEVPPRGRPMAFGITFLLVGLPLTFVTGLLLEAPDLLPTQITLPIALVLGYAASFGVSVIAWGHPGKWRQLDGYQPGIPPTLRMALFVPVAFATTMLVTLVIGIVGIDLFWGLLTGGTLGLTAALYVSGAIQRLRQARSGSNTLLPVLPDKVKPLILFPTWILTTGLLYTVTTYALPDFTLYNFLASLLIGLAVGVYIVEEPLLREMRTQRHQERQRRAELEARRKERLQAAKQATPPEPET